MRRFFMLILASIVGIFIAPIIGPTLARLGRPVAKAGVSAGVSLYRSGRIKLAELQETLEDLVAEARTEQQSKDITES